MISFFGLFWICHCVQYGVVIVALLFFHYLSIWLVMAQSDLSAVPSPPGIVDQTRQIRGRGPRHAAQVKAQGVAFADLVRHRRGFRHHGGHVGPRDRVVRARVEQLVVVPDHQSGVAARRVEEAARLDDDGAGHGGAGQERFGVELPVEDVAPPARRRGARGAHGTAQDHPQRVRAPRVRRLQRRDRGDDGVELHRPLRRGRAASAGSVRSPTKMPSASSHASQPRTVRALSASRTKARTSATPRRWRSRYSSAPVRPVAPVTSTAPLPASSADQSGPAAREGAPREGASAGDEKGRHTVWYAATIVSSNRAARERSREARRLRPESHTVVPRVLTSSVAHSLSQNSAAGGSVTVPFPKSMGVFSWASAVAMVAANGDIDVCCFVPDAP